MSSWQLEASELAHEADGRGIDASVDVGTLADTLLLRTLSPSS